MEILNDKAALLGAAQRKQEVVEVEPGKGVVVIEIGASAYYELLADQQFWNEGEDGKKTLNMVKMSPHIAAASLANADGTCAGISVEEFLTLGRVQQDTIIAAAFRVNGLVGDNEKNSEASPEDS
jgi:hypothetical protein